MSFNVTLRLDESHRSTKEMTLYRGFAEIKIRGYFRQFIRQVWEKHLANLVVLAFSGNKGQLVDYLDEKKFIIKSHRP